MHKRVLIADASETIVTVCRKMLTQHGYDATVFQDGTKALEELKRSDYDLAVIATTTQNVSGYFIIKELRKDRSKMKMPVLLLLGSSELLDTKELVDVSPEDTLNKPFSPQELLTKIDKLLAKDDPEGSSDDDEELAIEDILNDDARSFDKKISSATDKIFLSMLSQANEAPSVERPRVDKLELSEDQFDLETPVQPLKSEDNEPHDYDWFINEMSGDPSAPRRQVKPVLPTGSSGKFQVEEIGTSKITLNKLKKMQASGEVEKTKVYIEKLNEPFLDPASSEAHAPSSSAHHDLKEEFIKRFAETLARELAKQIDFNKLVARITAEAAKIDKK